MLQLLPSVLVVEVLPFQVRPVPVVDFAEPILRTVRDDGGGVPVITEVLLVPV